MTRILSAYQSGKKHGLAGGAVEHLSTTEKRSEEYKEIRNRPISPLQKQQQEHKTKELRIEWEKTQVAASREQRLSKEATYKHARSNKVQSSPVTSKPKKSSSTVRSKRI